MTDAAAPLRHVTTPSAEPGEPGPYERPHRDGRPDPPARPAPDDVPGASLRASPRARRAWWVALALVLAAATTFLVDPDGIGPAVYLLAITALHLALTFGPVLRGVRPRRVWLPQTLAGLFIIASVAARVWPGAVGPVEYKDIAYFSAYALLIVWLVALCRHVGGGSGRDAALDTAAAVAGTALAVWIVTLAPLANGSGLLWGLVWMVYPTADALLVALSFHLSLRLGVRIRSAVWLTGSLALQTVLDVATSVVELRPTSTAAALLECVYLLSFLGLATAACHPSVVRLSRPRTSLQRRRRIRAGTLITVALLPPIFSTLAPITGRLDMIVRTVLMTLLLGLVFARLTWTLHAVHRAEADSRHRATHDSLTGLLNRAGLLESLAVHLARDAREGASTALVFLDFDDFKHVNDTWGHQAGDTLLRDVAARLTRRLGPGDLVARHGGDEFVVVTSVADPSAAMALGRALQRDLTTPLRIRPGRRHAVTVSIGVGVAAPGETVGTEELLRRADIGMYSAKLHGRGRVVLFDDELAEKALVRARVGDRIEDAIRADALKVMLQPVMGGPAYDRLVGWEALARWHDEELGHVPPDEFVPAAEQLGLMRDLGANVLRLACRDVARLHRSWPPDQPLPGLSVNVSPTQLLEPDIVETVLDAARSAGLPLRFLRLEVTETLLVDDGPDVCAVLEELRATGVAICIDDFGTGYASLATLLRLPIDAVKIDRSLVTPIGIEEAATRQLGAVLDLLRSLGIERIVAEGVETGEQEAVLLRLGCPTVQGWRYGRPAPADTWLPESERVCGVGAGEGADGADGCPTP